MSSRLSTLGQLFEEINARAREISSEDVNGRTPLITLLLMSFMDAMEDIRVGGEFDEFADLAILNVIIRGNEEGYSHEELQSFVRSLQSNEN